MQECKTSSKGQWDSLTFNKKQIEKEIENEIIKKEGLSSKKINKFLKNEPKFLGCYAQDELKSISIQSLPASLIVNFDNSFSSGTHWIALRISKNKLEIFDPLGFNVQRWPNIPHHLLDFLHKFSLHRNIRISREIQPLKSTLCGFYCVFFILCRRYYTFNDCVCVFSNRIKKNDKILLSLFQ